MNCLWQLCGELEQPHAYYMYTAHLRHGIGTFQAQVLVMQDHADEIAVFHLFLKIGRVIWKSVLTAGIFKLHHPLVGEVPYQMVFEVNMLVRFVSIHIACHTHDTLVVHMYRHG